MTFLLVLSGCIPGGEVTRRTEGSLSHSVLCWTDILTRSPYDALRVVIHHDRDHSPSPASLDLARDELERLAGLGALDKPGGIELVIGDVVDMTDADHVGVAIDDVLTSVARPSVEGGPAVVNVLYADGHLVEEGSTARGVVLGYAYGGGYLVLLPDAVEATCRGGMGSFTRTTCEVIEAMVLVHELGHLFGLVGNGAPMVTDHVDAGHGSHDSSEDCVMYWSIPRRDVAAAAVGWPRRRATRSPPPCRPRSSRSPSSKGPRSSRATSCSCSRR